MKLKATKSQSIRSIQSTRSLKSLDDCLEKEKALDFDEMITTACNKFQVSRRIFVKKDFRIDEYQKSMKQTGPIQLRRNTSPAKLQETLSGKITQTDESDAKSTTSIVDVDTVVITAVYDRMNKLGEILLYKQRYVSRKIVKIIGLIAPVYRQLVKMTIKRSNINGHAIYEMSKFLNLTTITEVCLDDSPCLESNYALLLNKPCRLISLSLCRCKICDETCIEIASKLHYSESAEQTLSALNLSSNRITDVGARNIGEALRSNRHLRYLNLAGNWISDNGADHIFCALTDFTLTYDEIMAKRGRYVDYLKVRQAVYLRYYSEWDSRSMDESSIVSKHSQGRKMSKSRKDSTKSAATDTDGIMQIRAEVMARDFIGPFVDPFSLYSTKSIDGLIHCFGNMVLCYLNLSYNNLSYLSLKRLNSVVLYQNTNKKLGQVGLLKVDIDGNAMPEKCPELEIIGNLLLKNIVICSPKFMADRRKSKGRISILPGKTIATK